MRESGTTSETVTTVPGELLAAYRDELERSGLAPATRRSYARGVAQFLEYCSVSGVHRLPLSDGLAAEQAARDFRRELKARGLAPETLNGRLAAASDYCRRSGLGVPKIARERVPERAPKALDEAELRSLLRSLERYGTPRDRAAVALMVFAGLRVSEVAALDTGDLELSARRGAVRVRRGKGDLERRVPLPAEARAALEAYLDERGRGLGPLFPGPVGRASQRSLHRRVARMGSVAGLELYPHLLRHTYITRLVRGGADLVLVAELAGHRRVETTRSYCRPSEADAERVVEGLFLDY